MSDPVSNPSHLDSNRSLTYRVQRRGTTAKHFDACVEKLEQVFGLLDEVAVELEPNDCTVAEVVNAAADILRGVFDKAAGVDIQPMSELGPHDDVDLRHSVMVLTRVVDQVLLGEPQADELTTRVDSLEARLDAIMGKASQTTTSRHTTRCDVSELGIHVL